MGVGIVRAITRLRSGLIHGSSHRFLYFPSLRSASFRCHSLYLILSKRALHPSLVCSQCSVHEPSGTLPSTNQQLKYRSPWQLSVAKMSPGLESSFPPSGYGSGHGARRDHKRPGTSLFQHANHTFVSKPPDPPPPAGAPLFSAGRSVTSFTFSAGSPSGTAINNPFASSNEPHPPAPPTFNFTRPQGSRDVSGSSSGSSSGSASFTTSSPSESTESLSSGMASLKIGYLPRRKSPDSSQDKVSSDPGLGCDDDPLRDAHLRLLGQRLDLDEISEIQMTPLFTEPVRRYALSLASASKEKPFSQYGLLAGDLSGGTGEGPSDPRIFWNIAAPSSVFICGSQGSGKSHTLSCLLENALAPCKANVLPRPLTGIVFHYDTFISDSGGSPCEVAWLSSNPDIKVRVLCPPTNIRTIQVSLGPRLGIPISVGLTGPPEDL